MARPAEGPGRRRKHVQPEGGSAVSRPRLRAPRAVAAAGHTAGRTHVEELDALLLKSGQSSGEPEGGGRARAGPRGGNPEAEAGF